METIKINESLYIALFVGGGFIKELLPIEDVNISIEYVNILSFLKKFVQ